MSAHDSFLLTLVTLGFFAAILGLVYFLFTGLRSDHERREYGFTWGVAVVVLFLMGFAPGVVAVGLYLVVEHDYPAHWLLAAVVLAFAVVGAVGLGVQTDVAVTESAALAARSPAAAA